MFWRQPKLPVSEPEQQWVDEGFRRLSRMLGSSRMVNAEVVLPTDDYFPDPYDNRETGVRALFHRVCGYMDVNPATVDLEIIPDTSELMDLLPAYSQRARGPAGVHFGAQEEMRPLIGIAASLMNDPLVVIATLAHELGHVILLGGNHITRETEDMEPMTDLVTVYLGVGVFIANASRRFTQHQDNFRQGWSMKRHGYLPEPVFAYALARFAHDRGESRPAWTSYLSTNLKAYFRQSAAWLEKDRQPIG